MIKNDLLYCIVVGSPDSLVKRALSPLAIVGKEAVEYLLKGIKYEPRREKTGFCICENKDADQLRGKHEADQRLCFRYTDSTIPLLS